MSIGSILLSPWAVVAVIGLYYLIPYFQRSSLRNIPGPFIAAFSNLWLLWQCRLTIRSLSVDSAHKKYGKIIRIQPDHISIADDAAIPLVYGHGNGFLKSHFYDAFVSINRGLFNVRDRADHTRKRKIVSHTFSTRSIGQFEQYMHHNIEEFVKQWDSKSKNSGGDGYARLDALQWFNYLAFDIIGDLAFGSPFGMIEKGADIAEVRATPTSAPTYAPAVEVLNRRGEVSGAIGIVPAIKPYAKWFPDPFFSKGVRAVENLAGIARARVRQRLDVEGQTDRVDLLARLMQGKDDNGQPLGRDELTAEALTQLIAGSDTTSNTSCAILFHVLQKPNVVEKLQQELDEAIPDSIAVPTYDMVKDLKYVDNVIKESMRIHSTSSMGLPRLVPEGPGVDILGHHFAAGTVLSVPAYSIHTSTEIWGNDALDFVPERWEKGRLSERQKNAFIPFSYGPRSCVGRNVAEMELALIVSTVFKRYEFICHQTKLRTAEGFLRKPLELDVSMRKRHFRKNGSSSD